MSEEIVESTSAGYVLVDEPVRETPPDTHKNGRRYKQDEAFVLKCKRIVDVARLSPGEWFRVEESPLRKKGPDGRQYSHATRFKRWVAKNNPENDIEITLRTDSVKGVILTYCRAVGKATKIK